MTRTHACKRHAHTLALSRARAHAYTRTRTHTSFCTIGKKTGARAHTHTHKHTNTHIHTQTHTLILLQGLKRQVFCLGDRLTMDKAWATTIVAPKSIGQRPQKAFIALISCNVNCGTKVYFQQKSLFVRMREIKRWSPRSNYFLNLKGERGSL